MTYPVSILAMLYEARTSPSCRHDHYYDVVDAAFKNNKIPSTL